MYFVTNYFLEASAHVIVKRKCLMVKKLDFNSGFKFWSQYWLAVWHWAWSITSLNLSFLIFKIGIYMNKWYNVNLLTQ